MERTNLEGTLQVDAEDGGAPVQVSCERHLRPYNLSLISINFILNSIIVTCSAAPETHRAQSAVTLVSWLIQAGLNIDCAIGDLVAVCHAQVEAKVLRRMEEGGNDAERAMAAKYAKAIKADQVGRSVNSEFEQALIARPPAETVQGPALYSCALLSREPHSASCSCDRWRSCCASARGPPSTRRCSTGCASSYRPSRR